MLLVVLAHAAPTGALAQTRMLGSAFDPTTAAVTLGPKRTPVAEAVRKEARLDPPATASPLFAVGAGPAEPPRARFAPDPAQANAVAVLPERLMTRPVGTRAPPAA